MHDYYPSVPDRAIFSRIGKGCCFRRSLTPHCYLGISRPTFTTAKFGSSWLYRLMALVPPNPSAGIVEDDETVCTKEHCFRCFDALFCALTGHKAIAPQFPDEK